MSVEVLDFGAGFSRRAQQWERVAALRPAPGDPHFRMARLVFATVISAHGARMLTGELGACRIDDPCRLGAATGLDAAVWVGAPASFRQGEVLIAPWPVSVEIVSAAAAMHSGRLRALVGRETKTRHLCCQHGNVSATAAPDPDAVRYCCKCEYGLRHGPALEHDSSFYCAPCDTEHPGSRHLDGCPQWWKRRPSADSPPGR